MGEETDLTYGDFDVQLLRGVTPEREQYERALAEARHALPLPQRAAWTPLLPSQDSWLLVLRDREGQLRGGVGLQVSASRALPGHLLLRVERFGPGLTPEAQAAALRAIVGLASENRWVLRVYVETFSTDSEERLRLTALLSELGFAQLCPSRCYEQTLVIDLTPDEDTIFANLHASARKNIRWANKNPVEVRPSTDPALFGRMDDLFRETFARTGGQVESQNWAAVVSLCEREPNASRLVGLFRTDLEGPEALLAFAWGCGHGDHVHYSKAASTRHTGRRMPLTYPLAWDLIRWAKANGARQFDLGGVTMGSHDDEDRLGGISDFKRFFSKQVVDVGAEWAYEPRPLQARAANAMRSASAWLSRLTSRVS